MHLAVLEGHEEVVKELLDHDLKSGARGWLLKFNSVEELAKMWWLL